MLHAITINLVSSVVEWRISSGASATQAPAVPLRRSIRALLQPPLTCNYSNKSLPTSPQDCGRKFLTTTNNRSSPMHGDPIKMRDQISFDLRHTLWRNSRFDLVRWDWSHEKQFTNYFDVLVVVQKEIFDLEIPETRTKVVVIGSDDLQWSNLVSLLLFNVCAALFTCAGFQTCAGIRWLIWFDECSVALWVHQVASVRRSSPWDLHPKKQSFYLSGKLMTS